MDEVLKLFSNFQNRSVLLELLYRKKCRGFTNCNTIEYWSSVIIRYPTTEPTVMTSDNMHNMKYVSKNKLLLPQVVVTRTSMYNYYTYSKIQITIKYILSLHVH